MAKATAICKCKSCGATFKMEATKYNRREADNWEEWAVSAYTTCPDCYKLEMREQEKEKGLFVDIIYDIDKYDPADEPTCVPKTVVLFGGDTWSYKDAIKAYGAKWTDNYDNGALNMFKVTLGITQQKKRWAVWLPDDTEETFKKIMGELKELGVTKVNFDKEKEYAKVVAELSYRKTAHAEYLEKAKVEEQEKAEKQKCEEKKAALLEKRLEELGPKPKWTEDVLAKWIPADAKWNGSFYGKKGKWRIYLNGKQIDLTNEEKKNMEETYVRRQEWTATKEKIIKEVENDNLQ